MKPIPWTEYQRVLKLIRKNCAKCAGGRGRHVKECTTTSCHFYNDRLAPPPQLDVFDGRTKAEYIRAGVEYAETFFNGTPRLWDDFKAAYHRDHGGPVHPNWTGGLARVMQRSGFRRLDITKMSTSEKNNGTRAFMWVKE